MGQHNGLPTSIIIRTTLQDLESRAGVGTTGGGTLMPIKDVIRLAGHAHHWLAIFDKATGQALDLFRTKRVASPAQRIMLIARDGGCTKPCCTVPAYGSQVHHALRDWAETATPTSTNSPWPAGRTTASSTKMAAGPPPSTTAATSNGSPHPHSTTAKPASTTTTAPNYSYAHQTNPTATQNADHSGRYGFSGRDRIKETVLGKRESIQWWAKPRTQAEAQLCSRLVFGVSIADPRLCDRGGDAVVPTTPPADIARLPIAPRNPLTLRQQVRAVKAFHTGQEVLRDAGGHMTRLKNGPTW